MTESTDFNELAEKEPWLNSSKLVVKPDMLFGKRGKSGLVALNLDLSQVATFVKERLGKEVIQIFADLVSFVKRTKCNALYRLLAYRCIAHI